MKVVGLVSDHKKAYTWWRIDRPFEHLRLNGIDAQTCWLNSNEEPELDIRGATVVLPRLMVTGNNEQDVVKFTDKLRLLGAKKLVYELDDDIVTDAYEQYMRDCGRATLVSLEKIESERRSHIAFINACDEVTTTTDYLAKRISTVTKTPIRVIPNYIDIEWFKSRLCANTTLQKNKNYVTIGIGGGLKPEYDYKMLAEAWKYVDKKYKNIRFVIAGYQPDTLYEAVDYDKIIRVPHSRDIETWPANMQMDIGCCPLTDTYFNRAKSNIKALEYICAGTLPIASNIVYAHSGIPTMPIATSVNGWKYFLSYFIDNWLDKELHIEKLFAEAESNFSLSLQENWGKWAAVYES